MNPKALLFLFIILCLFFVVGCSLSAEEPEPAASTPVAIPEPEPTPEAPPEPLPETEPAPEEIPVPAPKPVAAPAQPAPSEQKPAEEPEFPASASGYADERVTDLIVRHQKTESYSFYYATSEYWNLLRDQYFHKGTNIKIKLYEPNQWNKRTYFDTVYMDTSTQTAEAYCESRERERCPDRNKKFEVSYADYKISMPTDWILSVPKNSLVVGGEQVEDRAAIVIGYPRDDGATVRMSVDKFSGTPILVQVYRGDMENLIERYLFKELSVNNVKSSEMMHQS